jgi:hypothetical protein
VPALLAALDRLPAAERCRLAGVLLERWDAAQALPDVAEADMAAIANPESCASTL